MATSHWRPGWVPPPVRQWLAQRRADALEAALQDEAAHAARLEADWQLDQALAAWDAIRARAPAYPLAQTAHARVLGRMGRERDAIALLTDTTTTFPDLVYPLVDLHDLLCRVADFEGALRIGRTIARRFADLPTGFLLAGRSLRLLGRHDEAEAVLRAAHARFTDEPDLAVELFATADVRGDRAGALQRGEALVRDFPDFPLAHACLGAALKKAQCFEEADRVLAAAMARFPTESNLAVNHAWVADEKGDWDEALRRWSDAVARFGREPRVRVGYLETLSHAELARIDAAADATLDAATAAAPPPAPALGPEATRFAPLMTRFQGLGSDCEFGFVQRHFGAEPMGLLRWAGIARDKLLIGLDEDFAGVGGEERTRLNFNESNGEYFTTDTFYGLSMHTFVMAGSAAEKDLYPKMCRRLDFLRTRLLDDLASGDKLFVFHTAAPSTDEDARQLQRSIRRHGPGCLLFVRVAAGDEAPGTVRDLGDGLAVGLIDRSGLHNNHWAISFDCWLRLCQGAEALLAPHPVHA